MSTFTPAVQVQKADPLPDKSQLVSSNLLLTGSLKKDWCRAM